MGYLAQQAPDFEGYLLVLQGIVKRIDVKRLALLQQRPGAALARRGYNHPVISPRRRIAYLAWSGANDVSYRLGGYIADLPCGNSPL